MWPETSRIQEKLPPFACIYGNDRGLKRHCSVSLVATVAVKESLQVQTLLRDPAQIEAARLMRSSAEEHLVDIEGVTGSIPVASTILLNDLAYRSLQALARNWPETLLQDDDRPVSAAGVCRIFGLYRRL